VPVSFSSPSSVRAMEWPSATPGTDGSKAEVFVPQLTESIKTPEESRRKRASPPLASPFPIELVSTTNVVDAVGFQKPLVVELAVTIRYPPG